MEDDLCLGKLLKLLQGSIRAAGLTQTEVDERIGRRRGYLSHVFQRRVDLKLIDLLRALEVLEIDPARFLSYALGARSDGRVGADETLHLMGTSRVATAVPSPSWSRLSEISGHSEDSDWLAERVLATVRKVLAEVEGSRGRVGQVS